MTHIRNLIRSGIVSDATIELKYANVVYAADLCATAGPGGAHRMGHAKVVRCVQGMLDILELAYYAPQQCPHDHGLAVTTAGQIFI